MNSASKKEFIKLGLSEAFRRGYSRYKDADTLYVDYNDSSAINYKRLLKTLALNPSLITETFDDLDPYYQHSFMRACYIEGVCLYSYGESWANRIDSALEFENPHDGYRAILQRDSIASVASLLKPNFNWSIYFKPIETTIKVANYVNPAWAGPLEMYRESNEVLYKNFLEDILFQSKSKPSHDIRGYLYKKFIDGGYLTTKYARKMRSDGSEAASVRALESLLNNESNYSNFDELVLNFSDSRYEAVLTKMARAIPERLLPSIMGAAQRFPNSQYALAKRFQEIEEHHNE